MLIEVTLPPSLSQYVSKPGVAELLEAIGFELHRTTWFMFMPDIVARHRVVASGDSPVSALARTLEAPR